MPPPLLPFPAGTRPATFLRREKRFKVLVELDGCQTWVHTNNSGSMRGLLTPGIAALVSPAGNPNRTLAWTLEALEVPGGWASVNTLAPNRLLRAAFEQRQLPELADCTEYRAEARVGASRLDALLHGPAGEVWVEAKNVTLASGPAALFPDAATERGRKHLGELMILAGQGCRVAMFYLVSLPQARCFAPAADIDPAYAELFFQALTAGVEAWPYQAVVAEDGLRLGQRLPLCLPAGPAGAAA